MNDTPNHPPYGRPIPDPTATVGKLPRNPDRTHAIAVAALVFSIIAIVLFATTILAISQADNKKSSSDPVRPQAIPAEVNIEIKTQGDLEVATNSTVVYPTNSTVPPVFSIPESTYPSQPPLVFPTDPTVTPTTYPGYDNSTPSTGWLSVCDIPDGPYMTPDANTFDWTLCGFDPNDIVYIDDIVAGGTYCLVNPFEGAVTDFTVVNPIPMRYSDVFPDGQWHADEWVILTDGVEGVGYPETYGMMPNDFGEYSSTYRTFRGGCMR